MKKSIVVSLSLIGFLLIGATTAQTQSADKSANSTAAKIVSISGKLSADGKSFLGKHGKSWSIANPDAVSGHAGHELKLKCQVLAATHEIQVLAVKVVATEVRLTANPSDSAFHR